MSNRRLVPALLGAVAAIAAAILILGSGGDDRYRARLVMDNAGGLRPGSPVNIGGVPVGSVSLKLDKARNKVVATLNIEKKHAPLGRDATAAIVAQNVLGQKQVSVIPGDTSRPAPSGFEIPPARVAKTTDLDQVLDVLDAGTRARLAVLVNEAGQAFTGRRMDFNKLLEQAPRSLADATTLLQQLDSDNAALDHLLATSSRYVAETTAKRANLVRLVDRVGRTAETVASKRVELRQTLAGAPAFLSAGRRLLASLRTTAQPLGGAARNLTASAAPLQKTLDELEPFRKAAAPALDEARVVAPTLSRLGTRATPVLERAQPVLSQLDTFSAATLPPVTKAVDGSIDNTLAVVENWARAIQFRDGLSHIFRGEASFAPDALDSALARLIPKAKKKQRAGGKAKPTPADVLKDLLGHKPATSKPKVPLPPSVQSSVDKIGQAVDGVVDKIVKPKDHQPSNSSDGSVSSLLDFLLGS